MTPNWFKMALSQRVVTFLLFAFGGFVLTVLASAAAIAFLPSETALRLTAVCQDVLLFILPPVLTAGVISWMPALFLAVDNFPKPAMTVLGLVTLAVMFPAINWLVDWNESIRFPESLKMLEEAFQKSEADARTSIDMLMGDKTSVGSLIVSILIVGVMAGLSEEFFFRGGIMRLMTTARINTHVAVWVTAFIFSAIHFQFFGFFPRLLLGAYFGYLAVWSGSLWLPVMAHILNNTAVVVSEFGVAMGFIEAGAGSWGGGGTAAESLWAGISAAATLLLAFIMSRLQPRRR